MKNVFNWVHSSRLRGHDSRATASQQEQLRAYILTHKEEAERGGLERV